MAPVLPYALLGLFCSLTPTFGIKTKLADTPGTSEVVNGPGDAANGGYLEANCGLLFLRGGLPVGGSLKVTSSGWSNEEMDFELSILHSNSLAKLPGGDHGTEGHQLGQEDTRKSEELPSEPVLGVRLAGSGTNSRSAVLLYQGEAVPKEVPLSSPAGPTTPFMILINQEDASTVRVTVFTWISGGEGGAGSGSWSEASQEVGLKERRDDLQVLANESVCGAKYPKFYASPGVSAVTVQSRTCGSTEQRLVELSKANAGSSGE